MKLLGFFLIIFLISCTSSFDYCDLDKDGTIQVYEQKLCSMEKNESVLTVSDQVIAHIGVHLETQSPTNDLSYQEEYWPYLVDLVNLTDSYGYSLTLKMTPQWAQYIGMDIGRTNLVLSWINSHELAIHHHGFSHAGWDGYTDGNFTGNPAYDHLLIGNIDEMFSYYDWYDNWLVYSGTDEDTDIPPGVLYETQGYPAKSCCLLSNITVNELGLKELMKQGFVTGKGGDASLNDVRQAILNHGGQYLGVTLTDIGYSENKGEVVKLFDLLAQHNVSVLTVSKIMGLN